MSRTCIRCEEQKALPKARICGACSRLERDEAKLEREKHYAAVRIAKASRKERGNREGRRWLAADDRMLKFLWGSVHTETICKNLRRTYASIRSRATKLQLGPATRGFIAARVLAKKLGYDKATVIRALGVLGAKVKRSAVTDATVKNGNQRSRKYMITESQADAVEKLLIHDFNGKSVVTAKRRKRAWGEGTRPIKCIEPTCGTSDPNRRYGAHGYCRKCYDRLQKRRVSQAKREAEFWTLS